MNEQDIDTRLDELDDKETAFDKQCRFTSANRIATEIRRLAKAEGRFMPYLSATFTIMNNAKSLLEPIVGREASVEMISLLESEDRARAIQPNLPEHEYEECVNWYSSCAYDNLATYTAELSGYNSDGVHSCMSQWIILEIKRSACR